VELLLTRRHLRNLCFFLRNLCIPTRPIDVISHMGAARWRSASIICLCSVIGAARAGITFEDFASTQELELVGDAAVSGKALRLTPARTDRLGAAWFREKQPVGSN
jgi:hypothetical protein